MKILFVCTGNTCRSPMAQYLLEDRGLEGLEVSSAGIFAMEGMEASENAIEVLREEAIDLDSHRARFIGDLDLEGYDLILTMSRGQRDGLKASFPELEERIYTIYQYGGEASGDVIDPFGGDLGVYRETRDELKALLDIIVEKIGY